MANYYHHRRELETAEAEILEARALLPGHTAFMNRHADILCDQKRFRDAERVLRSFPERDSIERDLELANLWLLEAQALTGDRGDERMAQARELIERLEALGAAKLGRLSRKVGNTKFAIAIAQTRNTLRKVSYYLSLLDSRPFDVHALVNAGRAMIGIDGTRPAGRVFLRQVLELDRTRGDALRLLAESYVPDNRPDLGIQAYRTFRAGETLGPVDRRVVENLLAKLPEGSRAKWLARLQRDHLLPAEKENR
jgi:hypothetical protein